MNVVTKATISMDTIGNIVVKLDFEDISKQIDEIREDNNQVDNVIVLIPRGCTVYGKPILWENGPIKPTTPIF